MPSRNLKSFECMALPLCALSVIACGCARNTAKAAPPVASVPAPVDSKPITNIAPDTNAIAPVMLPHLRDRPLTVKRYPDGVEGKAFFEKNSPSHRPAWVRTVAVASGRSASISYTVVDDLDTLLWLANLAALELHVPLAVAGDLARPGARARRRLVGFRTAVEAARSANRPSDLRRRSGELPPQNRR